MTKKGLRARAKVSGQQMVALAAEAIVSPSTVRAWAIGEPVRQTTLQRLARAAEKLGVEVLT